MTVSPQLHPGQAEDERRHQLEEAARVLQLAWEAGVFDDLDPRVWVENDVSRQYLPGGNVVNDKYLAAPKDYLCERVGWRAAEVLAGQYPEVKIKVRKFSQSQLMWNVRNNLHPRVNIMLQLRSARRKKRKIAWAPKEA